MLKVYNAQERGAVGILIFSDPAQVAPDGIDKGSIVVFSRSNVSSRECVPKDAIHAAGCC